MRARGRRRIGTPAAAAPASPAAVVAQVAMQRHTTWRGPLPFDYAVSLPMAGTPGNVVQGVITVSAEAAFVATAIGYGFEEDVFRPIRDIVAHPVPQRFVPGALTLAQLPPRALLDGFRVNPRAIPLVFETDPDSRVDTEPERLVFRGAAADYEWGRRGEILQRHIRPGPHYFLVSLVDSGTGRELQEEPVHNLAALGRADGARPFRPLARPLAFLPRSTIRVQVIERQADRTGHLDIVLFGYKVPATSGVDEDAIRRAVAAELAAREQHLPGRVIPFDYVAQVQLRGQPGLEQEVELPINVEGSFVATAVSYAMDPPEDRVRPLLGPQPGDATSFRDDVRHTFNLRDLTLRRLPPDALLDGMRIRPEYVRFAFESGGRLSDAVRLEIADDLFERLNEPDDVRFRYRFVDGGAGRDLQNQPIFSIAGLGAADGGRPFKPLARPLHFEPRSTFRVVVHERVGRGTLHFVLQGYKRLEGRTP